MKHFKNLYITFLAASISAGIIFFGENAMQNRINDASRLEIIKNLFLVDKFRSNSITRTQLFVGTRIGRRILTSHFRKQGITAPKFLREKLLRPSELDYLSLGFSSKYPLHSYKTVISVKSAPLSECDVIFTEEQYDGSLFSYTGILFSSFILFEENPTIRFFDASQCMQGQEGLTGLIISSTKSNRKHIILPASFAREIGFVTFSEVFGSDGPDAVFREIDKITSNTHADAVAFMDLEEENLAISEQAFRRYVARTAYKTLGKIYGVNSVENAIDDLLERPRASHQFSIVNAPTSALITLAPWILFGMLWPMYRITKKHRINDYDDSSNYSVLSDTKDFEGKLGAFVFSMLPIIIIVYIGLYYLSITNSKIMYFGYTLDVGPDLLPRFYPTPPRGWIKWNTVWENLGAAIMWVNLFISLHLFYNLQNEKARTVFQNIRHFFK